MDILGSSFHRATLGTDHGMAEVATVALDRHLGAVAPATAGGYVLAAGGGFVHVDDEGSIRPLAQPAGGHPDVRMNDGACDAAGRFWAGTMAYDESPGAGSLFRLELDGTCRTMLTGLTISNGIGWSPDGSSLYLADSGTGDVDRFEFDPVTGALGRRHTLVHVEGAGVVPDGLTVDEDGGIWVALWGGGAVARYAPDGSLLMTVTLPVDRPTSCAFGGPGRASLFVTTSRHGLDDEMLRSQPDAGRVFRVDGLGPRGAACLPYRGTVAPSPPPAAGPS